MVVKDEYGPGIADLVGINNNATSTFLGLPERPSMSAQFHAVDLTTTKSFYDTSDFATESAIYDQWDGGLRLLITSIPDHRDPTTWTWTMNISCRGPSLLTKSVPESGGLVCLAFAAGLLLFFRPRKRRHGQVDLRRRGKSPELLRVRLRGIPARKLSAWHQ